VNFPAFKKLSAHLDDDATAQPWLPFKKKIGDLFVLNSYIGKSYIKMLGMRRKHARRYARPRDSLKAGLGATPLNNRLF
jgi:hypothetical protein